MKISANELNGPRLLIPAETFPSSLSKKGLLTPTPMLKSNGEIRVFVGMRDEKGVSRIGWADISPDNGEVVNNSVLPVIELGSPGAFDSNGMILGDVFEDPVSGSVGMAFVGFNLFPSNKFLAYSGFAISNDEGNSFKRCQIEPALGPRNLTGGETIVAIHSVNYFDGAWHVLVAVGASWELINNTPFPRYSIHEAKGETLNTLVVSERPIIDNPPGIYRLGRPRYEITGTDRRIVATGGKRDGDYRAYEFRNLNGLWTLISEQPYPIDIRPGVTPYSSIQSAYPAKIEHPNGKSWVFFDGDNMGSAGVLGMSFRA